LLKGAGKAVEIVRNLVINGVDGVPGAGIAAAVDVEWLVENLGLRAKRAQGHEQHSRDEKTKCTHSISLLRFPYQAGGEEEPASAPG